MKPFFEQNEILRAKVAKKTAMVQYGILAFMAAQGGLMARLTYWEYSWDIMEPITFFLTYGCVIQVSAFITVPRYNPEVQRCGLPIRDVRGIKNLKNAIIFISRERE